jgi:type I restriction enzyme S subunit
MGMIGTVGEVALVKQEPKFAIKNVGLIKTGDKVLGNYMYYYLTSQTGRNAVAKSLSGSTQKFISLGQLRDLKVLIPDEIVQEKIVSVLSSYDDLIENNEKRIKILEEMAQRLYTEWFVKFKFPGHKNVKMINSPLGTIPEGWEVITFNQAVDVNPITKAVSDQRIKQVPMESLSNSYSVIDLDKVTYKEKASGAKLINGDTLFARITPCLQNGKTALVSFLENDEVACGSTEFVVFRPKKLTSSYIYLLARDENFREAAKLTMVGASGRQRVRPEFFASYKVVVPDPETLKQFEEIVLSNFQLVSQLHNINSNLAKTRDLLIPQLVTGRRELKS